MADEYTLHESTADSRSEPVYTSKQWAYQPDQNAGSYSSRQVIFDLSGFYNSQRFINPQEMVLVLPIVSTLTSSKTYAKTHTTPFFNGLGVNPYYKAGTDGINSAVASFGNNGAQITDQFAMGFKSGYWNLVNSIQIQVDGKDVIQTIPNINYHASFVANTTWSQSDVQKHGPMLGFLPDQSDSWKVIAGRTDFWSGSILGSSEGWGICNNSLTNAPSAYPNNGDRDPFEAKDATTNEAVKSSNTNFLFSGPVEHHQASVNSAFFERMKWTNRLDKVASITSAPLDAPVGNSSVYSKHIAMSGAIKDSLENYMSCEAMAVKNSLTAGELKQDDYVGADADCTLAYRQLCTTCVIRFKDICHLFGQLPISRGLYMRMVINVNLGSLIIPTSGTLAVGPDPAIAGYPLYVPDGTDVGSSAKYINNFLNPTCPIMLAPLKASALTNGDANSSGTPLKGAYPKTANLMIYPGMAADSGTTARGAFVLSVNIAKTDPIHVQHGHSGTGLSDGHKLSSCFIYAPIIDMEPAVTSKYLTENKIKGVNYKDVYSFVIPSVTTSSSFTIQLANGIVNAERLIMIPYFLPSSSTALDKNMLFEPLSPFDSAPATTAPMAELSQFQVLISNMNVVW